MSFWVFLDLELEKPIEIFGISTLKFAQMQKNCAKQQQQKISDQKCLIWVFWAVSLKKYFIFAASSNLSKCKVSCEIKNLWDQTLELKRSDLGDFRL